MLRPFKRYGERALKYLGPERATCARDLLKRVGICHYLIAFRPVGSEGRFHTFDFGPVGGNDEDVCFSNTEKGLIPVEGDKSKAVRGEVRESFVQELSVDHSQIGTTSLNVNEIRSLCETFPQNYELHVNDCRHFVNEVAEVATGVKRASLVVGRDSMKRQSLLRFWSPWELGMIVTDYQNFLLFQRYSKTFGTAMAAITGGKIGLNMLKPANFGFLGQLQTFGLPQVVRNGGRLVVDKPLRGSAITATYATAMATFNESSFFREGVRLTRDLGDSIKAVAGVLEGATVGASAGAINALGNVGGTLRRTTLQVKCPPVVTQVLRFAPSVTKRTKKLSMVSEEVLEKTQQSAGKVGGVPRAISKVLPSLKMNKALQGRAMRLARPAYQLAMGANASV